jgi:hypothetical protein
MDYKSVLQEQIRELQKTQDITATPDDKCKIAEQISRLVGMLVSTFGN